MSIESILFSYQKLFDLLLYVHLIPLVVFYSKIQPRNLQIPRLLHLLGRLFALRDGRQRFGERQDLRGDVDRDPGIESSGKKQNMDMDKSPG